MAAIERWRVTWSGFPGGPGVSTFFFTPDAVSATIMSALHGLFDGSKAHLPSDVKIDFPSSYDVLEETTGTLTSSVGVTPAASVNGTSGSAYAAPAGVVMKWATGTVVDGHRLTGKTYLVPTAGFESTTGAPGGVIISDLTPVANAFITACGGSFICYSRHRKAVVGTPGHPERLGSHGVVVGASIPNRYVVLRSRRD